MRRTIIAFLSFVLILNTSFAYTHTLQDKFFIKKINEKVDKIIEIKPEKAESLFYKIDKLKEKIEKNSRTYFILTEIQEHIEYELNKDDNIEEKINNLPLLKKGQHAGMHLGFNASDTEKGIKSMNEKWNEAIEAGMKVDVFHIDWKELETAEGIYDKNLLEERLKQSKEQGLQALVFMPAIDSFEYVMPDYLKNNGAYELKYDMEMNDEKIVKAYNKLLDWVIPMAKKYNAWGIIAGNEADNYLENHPDKTKYIVDFLEKVNNHANTVDPDMHVAFVVTSAIESKDFSQALVDASDFAAYNMYCNDFKSDEAVSYEELKRKIDIRVKAAKGKEVVFQEVGCPSGLDDVDSIIIASEEKQRKWFESFFKVMKNTPELRVAYLFQLIDGDQFTRDTYYNMFNEGGSEGANYANYYMESFVSLGVLNYEDGSPKSAWQEYLKGVNKF